MYSTGLWWHSVACVLGACPRQMHSEAGPPPSEGQLQDVSVFCVLNVGNSL